MILMEEPISDDNLPVIISIKNENHDDSFPRQQESYHQEQIPSNLHRRSPSGESDSLFAFQRQGGGGENRNSPTDNRHSPEQIQQRSPTRYRQTSEVYRRPTTKENNKPTIEVYPRSSNEFRRSSSSLLESHPHNLKSNFHRQSSEQTRRKSSESVELLPSMCIEKNGSVGDSAEKVWLYEENIKKVVKMTLCECALRLPAYPSLITFQFHSLVVSLSMSCMPVIWHLKG